MLRRLHHNAPPGRPDEPPWDVFRAGNAAHEVPRQRPPQRRARRNATADSHRGGRAFARVVWQAHVRVSRHALLLTRCALRPLPVGK
eukprot:409923-Prymnesium_polylepis.1